MKGKNIHSVSGSTPTQIQQKPSIKGTEYESIKKNAESSYEHAKKHISFKQLLYTFFKKFPGIIKALFRTSPKKDKAETSAQEQTISPSAKAVDDLSFSAGFEDTYEKASEKVHKGIDQIYAHLPESIDHTKLINDIALQYRFGKLTYEEAFQQLRKAAEMEEVEVLEGMLNRQNDVLEAIVNRQKHDP